MPDLDQSEGTEGASATPSPDKSPDIETIVAKFVAAQNVETDKRFKGFQSLIDRKLGTLTQEFDAKLKTVLSPEEQAQLDQSSEAQELAELRQYKQVMEFRKEHPEAVDFFMEAMSQGSFEDQIAYIESKLGKAATQDLVDEAAADAMVSEGGPAPVVDANNPSRPSSRLGVAAALAQGEMNDAKADAILAASDERGALATLRKKMGR